MFGFYQVVSNYLTSKMKYDYYYISAQTVAVRDYYCVGNVLFNSRLLSICVTEQRLYTIAGVPDLCRLLVKSSAVGSSCLKREVVFVRAAFGFYC